MEWVETVAKTLAEAREMALDRLGVGEDDAEFEILEEPKPGLFGRVRGEARVRARVRPTAVRPKQDRRSRGAQPTQRPPAPTQRSRRRRSDGVAAGVAGRALRRARLRPVARTPAAVTAKRNRSKQQKELTAMGSDDEGAERRFRRAAGGARRSDGRG